MLILASKITSCVSVSAFVSIVCVPADITNSVEGINICAITARFEKYNSIIKKKTKNCNQKGKDTLNAIEVLIFKDLIDSYMSHEFE